MYSPILDNSDKLTQDCMLHQKATYHPTSMTALRVSGDSMQVIKRSNKSITAEVPM